MSKLSREELKEIIQRDRPGYRLVNESESEGLDETGRDTVPHVQAEANSPDLQVLRNKYLRKKYLGTDASAEEFSEDVANDSELESNSDEDEIIAVSPETATHPWDRSARPKTMVVSGKEKKIIGEQG